MSTLRTGSGRQMSPQAINTGADRVNKDLVDRRRDCFLAVEVDGPTGNGEPIVGRENLDGSCV